MNVLKTYRWAAMGLLLLLEAAMIWRATRPPQPEVYADPFVPSAEFSVHLSGPQGGWTATGQGLVMPSGRQGVRLYRFPKREGQRIFLTVDFQQPKGGTNKLHIHKSDPRGNGPAQDMILENRDIVFNRTEITQHIRGEGLFQIYLLASAPSAPEYEEAPLVTRFIIEYQSPEKIIHWPALIFFTLIATGIYAVLLLVLVPWGIRGAKHLLDAVRQTSNRWRWALLLVFIVASASVLIHPEHRMNKSDRFDDLAAIGTAALLHDNGYEVSEMFFRSRIRPALTAWILPWTELLPHRLSSSTFTPSDRKERMFFFYDRSGWSYGQRMFPELSAFFAIVLLIGLLAFVGMLRDRGVRQMDAALIFVFSAFFTWRCMYNSISTSANLATTIAGALLAWRAWRKPTCWSEGFSPLFLPLFLAGFVFSATVILKETFAVLAAGLFLYQLWTWREEKAWGRRAGQFALFWGAAAILPLIYYGLILDTGFAELPANHSLLYYHQKLHPEYKALTWWTGLRTYWEVFNVGLPLAALGLIALILRIRNLNDAQKFFLCWFVGTLSIVTMPYIFPRFLIFYIPPMAFLAVQGVKVIGGFIHTGSDRNRAQE